MKKLWWIIGIIIVVVVILWFLKTPIMSGVISRKMNVDVSMSSISMWPSYTKIRSFKIKNPPQSKTSDALECKKIDLQYSFSDLFGDPSMIDLIELDDVKLDIEFYNVLGTMNNWTEIASKIPKKKEKKEGGEVIIKKLVIKDFVAEVRTMGLVFKPEIVKRIDRMEFNNISSKTGFPIEQLIAKIFRSADLNKYLKDFLNPKNFWEELKSPYKNLRIEDDFAPMEQEESVRSL